MKAMRAGIVALLLTGAGFVLGGSTVYTWQRSHETNAPEECWEATVYLPLTDNRGSRFSDEEFQSALAVLVQGMGGATVIEEREGYWRDGGKICREPLRPVLVSFACEQLATFRETIRQVGRKLGQDVIYYRLEKLHVELLNVESAQ